MPRIGSRPRPRKKKSIIFSLCLARCADRFLDWRWTLLKQLPYKAGKICFVPGLREHLFWLGEQEEETRQVVEAAWSFFSRTIRSVDSLKRYQGLTAALRMVTNQVQLHHSHP